MLQASVANTLLAETPADQTSLSARNESKNKESDSSFSFYKLNYLAINKWFSDEKAQIKFQFSAKYRILKGDLNMFKHNYFPLYFAYTQKSFWNIGQPSAPFEESNYNPEVFLDYALDYPVYERIMLRHIIISPFEHESNGQGGIQSRSWNRQYIAFTFGLEPKEHMDKINSFIQDKIALQLKFWHAYEYGDQEDYLRSIGSNEGFPDYMGRGELGLSIRNLFGSGSWGNNQLDVKTRLFRDRDKDSYEFVFQQRIPESNFSVFLQYYYGYGESLLRFDHFDRRFFAGISFSY
jgi:outer membrane phospholipase A